VSPLPEGHAPPEGAEVGGWTGSGEIREVVFTGDQIRARVAELGDEITGHYAGEDALVVLGLLKGSFIFLADLVRTIRRPLHVDFLIASSYGSGIESSGEVDLIHRPLVDLDGKHVLVVEDIVDSGTTLDRVLPWLERKGPRSLEVCTLLHKHLVRKEREPRWIGFPAPPDFLVGYGLDHAEAFRHLPFIGSL